MVLYGHGRVQREAADGMSQFCPACGGRGEGEILDGTERRMAPCAYCHASGRVSAAKKRQYKELTGP